MIIVHFHLLSGQQPSDSMETPTDTKLDIRSLNLKLALSSESSVGFLIDPCEGRNVKMTSFRPRYQQMLPLSMLGFIPVMEINAKICYGHASSCK